MTTQRKLLTAEELYAMPDDGFHRYELHRGEISQMSPTNWLHGLVVNTLAELLGAYVRQRHLGAVLSGDTGVTTERGPDTVLAPDVAYVARARIPRPFPRSGFPGVVPDLVVEVISPGDRPGAVRRKTECWLAAGALLVWNVYPDAEEIVTFRADAEPRTYTHDDLLDAEPVLPGFSVSVAEIFALPDEDDS